VRSILLLLPLLLLAAPDLSAQIATRYTPSLVARVWSPLGADAEIVPRSSFVDRTTREIDPDDGVAGPFAIGFPVEFDGQVYDSIYLSVDGWAGFRDPLSVDGTGEDLRDPSALFSRRRPSLLLAPYFGDHFLRATGIDTNDPQGRAYTPASIRIGRLRSPTRDTFVVEWRDLNVNHIFDPADTANPNAGARTSHAGSVASFQLRIIEGDSSCREWLHNANIEFRYSAVAGAAINPYGAAVGLESEPYIEGGATTFINGVEYAINGSLDSAQRSRRLSDAFPLRGSDGYALIFRSNASVKPFRPRLIGRPALKCIDPWIGTGYVDTICVRDEDFACANPGERLTLSVVTPSWITLAPDTITTGGNICHPIEISGREPNDTGRIRVVIKVVDRAGATDTLGYEVAVSEPIIVFMPLQIRNTRAVGGGFASQELVLGIARRATTGQDPSALGLLDSNFCEFELPPVPPLPVFDARWVVPTRTGTLRNIYPENPSAGQPDLTWIATFQPGYEEDSASAIPSYPIIISWSIADAGTFPIGRDVKIMDRLDGAIFDVDLVYPGRSDRLPADSSVTLRIDVDSAFLTIHESSALTGFQIRRLDWGPDGVEDQHRANHGYTLSVPTPNPFSSTIAVSYYTPKRSGVKIELFDMNGNMVRTLLDAMVEAGTSSVSWDGRDDADRILPSGTYLCRMSTGDVSLVRRIVLAK
jgi:hypothetical protein